MTDEPKKHTYEVLLPIAGMAQARNAFEINVPSHQQRRFGMTNYAANAAPTWLDWFARGIAIGAVIGVLIAGCFGLI